MKKTIVMVVLAAITFQSCGEYKSPETIKLEQEFNKTKADNDKFIPMSEQEIKLLSLDQTKEQIERSLISVYGVKQYDEWIAWKERTSAEQKVRDEVEKVRMDSIMESRKEKSK